MIKKWWFSCSLTFYCASFDRKCQKSVKNDQKMIKKRIKKHYLGDGLLTHVFWGVFLSCFYPVLVMFSRLRVKNSDSTPRIVLRFWVKPPYKRPWMRGYPPYPSFCLIILDWFIALRNSSYINQYIVCAKASKTTLDPRWQTKFWMENTSFDGYGLKNDWKIIEKSLILHSTDLKKWRKVSKKVVFDREIS